MVKKLPVLISFVIAALFTNAQSLSLSYEGTALDPNAEITKYGPATNDEIIVELDVTNNSGTGLSVLVKKVENYLVDSTENTFCWAGLCYAPFVYISPNAVNIAAGTIHEDDFSGHYNPKGHPGESSVSYVFYDEANPNDSVMVTVIYTTLTIGVDDNFSAAYSISHPYPNPATDIVKFDYNLPDNQTATVKIYSLLGSLVGEMGITSASGTLSFNTDKLEDGFYFYTLFSGNEKMESGKFILRR